MYHGTSLLDARVLITGGARGLGRQLALEAARRGADVTIWDLDLSRAEAVVAEIRAVGATAVTARVDVTDREQITAAAHQAGPQDVVINNAGIITGKRLLEASDEEIRRTFELNTLALFWVTRAFLPGMLERDRGTVATIASAAGLAGVARQTDYSASKWAAIGFTESLRAELRGDSSGAGTFVMCPFFIDTGMFDGVTTKFPRLLPILKEQEVARQALSAIESGKEQIITPWLARLLPAARILPVRLFDRGLDLLGINHTMDEFVGRHDPEAPQR
ncbi:short-chain dehydrogenase [Brachybacterium vulturis]|uniref:Short-chain dehydrogenase n=1 Tax=Brachybacterium vulturis TaxID=2017484 RepID=A0A291GMI7_9MICO|nr:SDR family oxidoreductase [Brachybacterium vulturis]ATG51184.1 short-chain dehydrogenase [Brachybacterium vulturis]